MCRLFCGGGSPSSLRPFQGGTKIKKGDKRGAEALRGARKATGAAKASKKGDKKEQQKGKTTIWGAKARGRGWAKPLDIYIYIYGCVHKTPKENTRDNYLGGVGIPPTQKMQHLSCNLLI